ncbi:aldehyde dehydrogenase family protein [Streptomyces sp. CA-132043]|uniref:aldehyde dehydrogenase family protein n=1 Tax=Streptomyces sp. CA-132043 TaxID=3240048 RepID=UPI003D8F7B40
MSDLTLHNIVDGRPGEVVARMELTDPATGEVYGTAPRSGTAEVDVAVAAARRALPAWRRSTPARRQEALLQPAGLVAEHADSLLAAEVRSTGKPRAATRIAEIDRSADQLRFFAGAARVLEGVAAGEYEEGFTSYIRREVVTQEALALRSSLQEPGPASRLDDVSVAELKAVPWPYGA